MVELKLKKTKYRTNLGIVKKDYSDFPSIDEELDENELQYYNKGDLHTVIWDYVNLKYYDCCDLLLMDESKLLAKNDDLLSKFSDSSLEDIIEYYNTNSHTLPNIDSLEIVQK